MEPALIIIVLKYLASHMFYRTWHLFPTSLSARCDLSLHSSLKGMHRGWGMAKSLKGCIHSPQTPQGFSSICLVDMWTCQQARKQHFKTQSESFCWKWQNNNTEGAWVSESTKLPRLPCRLCMKVLSVNKTNACNCTCVSWLTLMWEKLQEDPSESGYRSQASKQVGNWSLWPRKQPWAGLIIIMEKRFQCFFGLFTCLEMTFRREWGCLDAPEAVSEELWNGWEVLQEATCLPAEAQIQTMEAGIGRALLFLLEHFC